MVRGIAGRHFHKLRYYGYFILFKFRKKVTKMSCFEFHVEALAQRRTVRVLCAILSS